MTSGVPLALRYTLAFMAPLLVTHSVMPLAARLARRLGLVSRPRLERFSDVPTPFLGGLAVAAGSVTVGLAMSGWRSELIAILGCGIGIAAIGLIDDWRRVGPLVRVGLEATAAVVLWTVGVRAGLFGVEILDLGLTIAWVVLITNSINLLDNMDGLSSGVVAIAAVTFFAIAAGRGDYLVGSFALVVAGASVGFLRHNFPPARIYMGDAGSLMLGFLLSALALKLDLVGETGLMRSAVPALILGVPLFDTVLVVLARIRGKRPVYVGGTDHSSHRLAQRGLSVRAVALVTYAAQAACCAAALVLTEVGDGVAVPVTVGLAAIVAAALWVMLAMPHPDRTEFETQAAETAGAAEADAAGQAAIGKRTS